MLMLRQLQQVLKLYCEEKSSPPSSAREFFEFIQLHEMDELARHLVTQFGTNTVRLHNELLIVVGRAVDDEGFVFALTDTGRIIRVKSAP
jgi:hypothetical protein